MKVMETNRSTILLIAGTVKNPLRAVLSDPARLSQPPMISLKPNPFIMGQISCNRILISIATLPEIQTKNFAILKQEMKSLLT
jgi:hypothetical protein